jgi:DNA repair exonuclease SbcCD ATPase subunit
VKEVNNHDLVEDLKYRLIEAEAEKESAKTLLQSKHADEQSLRLRSSELEREVEAMAATYARSMDDIIAITMMAVDANASYADSIDSVFAGIKAIRGANEKLTDAYSRGIAQFKEWQMAATLLGGNYVSGAMALNADMIFWANQVTEAAGGLEALQALQQSYFENFYTDEERAEAARKVAGQSVDAFNQSIGRTGESAVDTRDELRAYIQSLDLTTESGRNAYIAALRLAEAIMALEPVAQAATESVKTLQDVFDEVFGTGNLRDFIEQYMDAIDTARELGATQEEINAIANQGLTQLKESAQQFASAVGSIPIEDFVAQARQLIFAAFNAGGFDVAMRYAEELERALQDAINAAIWKVVELKRAWEDFQLSILDRIGRLGEGPGVSPDAVWAAGGRMWNTFAAAWENMDLEQRLSAVNTMLGYIDQWVSASISHINDALNKQVEAINEAADAQIEAINAGTEALEKRRKEIQDYYDEQIEVLQDVLDTLGEWVNVVNAINDMIESLRYGGQNPLPPAAQMANMSAEIARLMAEFNANPNADLAEEIRRLLDQRLQMASQVYTRSDPRYLEMYNETMRMLQDILSQAPDDTARIEEIQKEIERLTREQNDLLEGIDDEIEAAREAAEAQIEAINKARDAQIKAAEAAAERLRTGEAMRKELANLQQVQRPQLLAA